MNHHFFSFLKQLFSSRKGRSGESRFKQESVVELELNQEDKRLFAALCQFLWVQGQPVPLIFDLESDVYMKQGINQATLKRLEEKDLVAISVDGFVKKGFGKHTRLFYCGRPTKIGFASDANNSLDLGYVLLTERGQKLVPEFKIIRNQEFYEYVIHRWYLQGLMLSSIQINNL